MFSDIRFITKVKEQFINEELDKVTANELKELDGKKVDRKKLQEIIEFLNLNDRLRHLPNELSGGQQQKVAIGRALMINPKIILADEPTGNLDSGSSSEVVSLLKKSNKEYKQTIVMITHNMEIAKCADRIIELEDGKIIREV